MLEPNLFPDTARYCYVRTDASITDLMNYTQLDPQEQSSPRRRSDRARRRGLPPFLRDRARRRDRPRVPLFQRSLTCSKSI